MDDLNAFERQVAGEFVRRAGPVRPVHAAAIFTAITTTQSPKWRFQSMFSATKFVVAGAIVALFGGFLLASTLTTEQDGEARPAAMTESPSLTTTEELLSGMITEEVEPGVLRVLNDGVRDIRIDYDGGPSVVVGQDGSVWVWTERDEVFRLGDEPTYPWSVPAGGFGLVSRVNTVFGPGVTVWHRSLDDPHGLHFFDGETWTVERPDTRFDAVTMGPDGHVWAMWEGKHIGRFDGEWEIVAPAPDRSAVTTPDESGRIADRMVVTQDGSIWIWPMDGLTYWEAPTTVHRFDGQAWQSLDLPGGDVGHAAVGQDGPLWWAPIPDGSFHRFVDDEWQRFDPAEDWPSDPLAHRRRLEVAPDGRLWVTNVGDEGGPYLFDGEAWMPYLFPEGSAGMDVASDGSMWALGLDDGHLYVITPEAVVATE